MQPPSAESGGRGFQQPVLPCTLCWSSGQPCAADEVRQWFMNHGRFLMPDVCDKELKKALLKYHPDRHHLTGMPIEQSQRAVCEITAARELIRPLLGRMTP